MTKSRNPKSSSDAYYSLYHSPGFAGIRSQIGHLVKHWRGLWKRVKPKAEPFLAPRRLYYVSRLKDSGTRLSTLLKRRDAARIAPNRDPMLSTVSMPRVPGASMDQAQRASRPIPAILCPAD